MVKMTVTKNDWLVQVGEKLRRRRQLTDLEWEKTMSVMRKLYREYHWNGAKRSHPSREDLTDRLILFAQYCREWKYQTKATKSWGFKNYIYNWFKWNSRLEAYFFLKDHNVSYDLHKFIKKPGYRTLFQALNSGDLKVLEVMVYTFNYRKVQTLEDLEQVRAERQHYWDQYIGAQPIEYQTKYQHFYNSINLDKLTLEEKLNEQSFGDLFEG